MVIFILIFVLFVRKFLFWDAFGNFFCVFPFLHFFRSLIKSVVFFFLSLLMFFFFISNFAIWKIIGVDCMRVRCYFLFIFHLDAIELHLTQYLDIIDWNFKCLEFQYESHISRNLYSTRPQQFRLIFYRERAPIWCACCLFFFLLFFYSLEILTLTNILYKNAAMNGGVHTAVWSLF